ncbi:hypothetical protein ANO11243_067450 [Dothideomycetidae sp. 11243]|nr:hypothetical protein ANO11243_067450 [fungal sp. No.11243]
MGWKKSMRTLICPSSSPGRPECYMQVEQHQTTDPQGINQGPEGELTHEMVTVLRGCGEYAWDKLVRPAALIELRVLVYRSPFLESWRGRPGSISGAGGKAGNVDSFHCGVVVLIDPRRKEKKKYNEQHIEEKERKRGRGVPTRRVDSEKLELNQCEA